ncbi:MAG: hypothetical protein WDW38_001085 [Sanguina aurantia]
MPHTVKGLATSRPAVCQAVQQRTVDVGGIPTETYCVSASQGPAALQVLVVPGNPGSARYFIPFLQSLDKALGGRADLCAITHAGHQGPGGIPHCGKLFSLAEQSEHKAAFLRQHCLLPGRPPVVVLAHSIGSHMAVAAVAQVEEELRVAAAGGQRYRCGYIGTGGQVPTQRALRAISSRYNLVALVMTLIRNLLPAWLLTWIIRGTSNGKMGLHGAATTVQLLHRPALRNNFYLATHEFRDLSAKTDHSLLASFGSRLAIMGAPKDEWMSRAQYDLLVQKLPAQRSDWATASCQKRVLGGVARLPQWHMLARKARPSKSASAMSRPRISWHPELSHAFCASPEQSVRMAGLVAELLADILPALSPTDARKQSSAGSVVLTVLAQPRGTSDVVLPPAVSPRL